jgi:hypothetical protein
MGPIEAFITARRNLRNTLFTGVLWHPKPHTASIDVAPLTLGFQTPSVKIALGNFIVGVHPYF